MPAIVKFSAHGRAFLHPCVFVFPEDNGRRAAVIILSHLRHAAVTLPPYTLPLSMD